MLQALVPTINLIVSTPFVLYPTLFIFGTIFGSFFKVVVDRSAKIYEQEQEPLSLKDKICEQINLFCKKYLLRQKKQSSESWHQGRSRCDHCGQQLAWYDNIPLLSYMWLGGKCRFCRGKIGLSYPLTELLTGCVFIFSAFVVLEKGFVSFLSVLPALLFSLLFLSILWLIFLFDWKYLIIPDSLVLALVGLVIIKLAVSLISKRYELVWIDLLIALSLFAAFLLLRYLPLLMVKKEGMGWGDVKLIAPLGFLLGYQRSLIGVFCAFIIGGVWGIILLVSRKAKVGQMVSFGPLLVLGAFIALGWGQELWQLYWSLL